MYPKKFAAMVEQFQRLPGVGSKTAERYAFEVLEWDKSDIERMITALVDMKDQIHTCEVCGNLTENNKCPVCEDLNRDHGIICVVQTPRDVIAMEKTNEFKGVYHVLNGVISTSKGILPEDINIPSLIERINQDTKEIIIATNPTVEGETTALYLAKLLEKYPITVTRIAHGLPMGGHLDYADELTLIKALEGRKEM